MVEQSYDCCEYLTYKEWKRYKINPLSYFFKNCEYLTYKEWKRYQGQESTGAELQEKREYLTYKEWKLFRRLLY